MVLWLSGLSGSGKSTIADLAEAKFVNTKMKSVILDGDSVRNGLCSDLGFSQEDRQENLRRVAEAAKLFAQNGNIVICCFISPLQSQREIIQKILANDFNMVYVKASLKKCEERDPKGLYKKARSGEIANFTGISSIYEEPVSPNLVLDTEKNSSVECSSILYEYALNIGKL